MDTVKKDGSKSPVKFLRNLSTLIFAVITGKHWEMSSFPETRVEKYINKKYSKQFVKYHRKQISRVYPKGSRIDSSNYDPTMMWCSGAQLLALNYQTPGKNSYMDS